MEYEKEEMYEAESSKARELGALGVATKDLDSVISELSEVISLIGDALQPVLRPDMSDVQNKMADTVTTGIPVSPSSTLTNDIRGEIGRLKTQIKKLNAIRQRVDC